MEEREWLGAHLWRTLPFSRPTAGNFPVVAGGGEGGDRGRRGNTCDVRRNGSAQEGSRENGVGPSGGGSPAHPIHSRSSAHSRWACMDREQGRASGDLSGGR